MQNWLMPAPEPPDSTESPTASGHTDTATQAAQEGDPLTQPSEGSQGQEDETPFDPQAEAERQTQESGSQQESDLRREEGIDGRSHY